VFIIKQVVLGESFEGLAKLILWRWLPHWRLVAQSPDLGLWHLECAGQCVPSKNQFKIYIIICNYFLIYFWNTYNSLPQFLQPTGFRVPKTNRQDEDHEHEDLVEVHSEISGYNSLILEKLFSCGYSCCCGNWATDDGTCGTGTFYSEDSDSDKVTPGDFFTAKRARLQVDPLLYGGPKLSVCPAANKNRAFLGLKLWYLAITYTNSQRI